MIWLYIFALTAGLMMIVPTVLQALDGPTVDADDGDDADERGEEAPEAASRPTPGMFEFAAFTATTFAAAGLVVGLFEPGRGTTLIAALALGFAAGAIHPEILALLARRSRSA